MSETRRSENSPAGRSLPSRTAAVPGPQRIVVQEKTFLGHINLRGDPDDTIFMSRVRTVLGLTLPVVPNTISEGADWVAYWLAPSEWLLIVPAERERAVASALRDALIDQFASIVEVSGGQMVLLLTGTRVRDLLAKGCPLDLDERAFGLGQCAQSHLAKAPILLRAVANGTELVVRRSFANYLWQWLESGAREYGGWVILNEGDCWV